MRWKEDKSELLPAVSDWWFCAYFFWSSPQSSSGAAKDLDSSIVKMISASWWMLPLLLYKQVCSCSYLTPLPGCHPQDPAFYSHIHHIHHQRKGNHTLALIDLHFPHWHFLDFILDSQTFTTVEVWAEWGIMGDERERGKRRSLKSLEF